MINNKFDTLFGGPLRKPESELTQKETDIARSVHKVTEEIVLKISKHVNKIARKKYLCLPGGVALNCVSNGKLLRAAIFDDIHIQPAADDAGEVIGATIIGWYQYFGKERKTDGKTDSMNGAYLGPQ